MPKELFHPIFAMVRNAKRIAVLLAFWSIGLLLVPVSGSAAELCASFPLQNRIEKLGGAQTSFAQGTFIDSRDTLRQQFIKYEADIRKILDGHGLGHVADALMQAVADGTAVIDSAVAPGDDFQWLAWRRRGAPVTTAPVCLATSQSYESYDVSVALDEGDRITTYFFSIPKICMNLAFRGSKSEAKPAPPPAAIAPAQAAPAAPPPAPESDWQPFIGPFVGLERRTRDLCNCVDDVDSGLAGLLGGVRKPVGQDGAKLLLQVGAAANLRESKWSTLFVDAGVDFDIGQRGFAGLGLGIWDINDSKSRDTTVYVHGGRDAWNWNAHAVQWFAQGRVFLDGDDVEDIGTDYAVIGGLRILFNEAR